MKGLGGQARDGRWWGIETGVTLSCWVFPQPGQGQAQPRLLGRWDLAEPRCCKGTWQECGERHGGSGRPVALLGGEVHARQGRGLRAAREVEGIEGAQVRGWGDMRGCGGPAQGCFRVAQRDRGVRRRCWGKQRGEAPAGGLGGPGRTGSRCGGGSSIKWRAGRVQVQHRGDRKSILGGIKRRPCGTHGGARPRAVHWYQARDICDVLFPHPCQCLTGADPRDYARQ